MESRTLISRKITRMLFVFSVLALSLFISTAALSASFDQHQPALPRPDHIIIVIEENQSYSKIIESPAAPYINSLAQNGALFTQSYAITHPSQPNYLALFSGLTQNITDNSCPHTFSTTNLASELIQAGRSFRGYSEDLPSIGSTICNTQGFAYVRKHNPWVNWQESSINRVPADHNLPFKEFPTDFSKLPTMSFVIPNQYHDMHDGRDPDRIQNADSWLKHHLDAYVQWAKTNNSLLILTWDEDDGTEANRIPTIFVGPMVLTGRYDVKLTHYNILRTIEEMYGLQHSGSSASAAPITNVWTSSKSFPRHN